MESGKPTISKRDMHKSLCDHIHYDLYVPKNADYGDSFHKLYEDIGIISAVTQIAHKTNRVINLAKKKDANILVEDESISDTLLDLANYCILTVMELRLEQISNQLLTTKDNVSGSEDESNGSY